jgi:hypothetical protein
MGQDFCNYKKVIDRKSDIITEKKTNNFTDCTSKYGDLVNNIRKQTHALYTILIN